ncbi:helix-turn-helix transcriptional regulator [Rhizobium sp. CCGE531]|uniref:helix-turn-helix domain-containing protein n=1 Tax=Rhizobium sp. CCGE531 TaxID=2364271 RepID=UPI000EAA2020|nr:helix-turn-helix transcriptional regulator [Rhizobium sp. CCGE531]AYG70328.1 XRE family transcriptional regulator [Rhizobium sp. CCGE531]
MPFCDLKGAGMSDITDFEPSFTRQRPSPLDARIHPVDRHVGQQIRILRIQANLSQNELGKGVGVSFQQMQKYESGKNRVSASMLYEIGSCLHVPVTRFFEGLPEPGSGVPHQEAAEIDERIAYLSTADGRRLIEGILRLSPRIRNRVLSIVGILAEEQEQAGECG